MKNNRKFTGIFSLNEVLDITCPHVDSMTKTIMNEEYKNYSEFLCSYAPYTLVSDFAANDELATEGFDMDCLDEIVDLRPTTLAGRIVKSAILSEARCSFGLGFFTKSHSGEVSDEQMSKIMDKIYNSIKYLSKRGGDTLARVLSYYYAKRALSLYQIHKLGELFKDNKGKICSDIIIAVILVAIECFTFEDLSRVITTMRSMSHNYLLQHTEILGFIDGPMDIEFASRCVMKGALLVKSVAAARYYAIENGSNETFGSYLSSYLVDLTVKDDSQFDTGLYVFGFNGQDFDKILDFAKEVGSILSGESNA